MKLIPHIDQIHTFRGPQVNLCRIDGFRVPQLIDLKGMQANPEPKIDPVRGCMGTSLLLWQELAQAVEDFFTLDHRSKPGHALQLSDLSYIHANTRRWTYT